MTERWEERWRQRTAGVLLERSDYVVLEAQEREFDALLAEALRGKSLEVENAVVRQQGDGGLVLLLKDGACLEFAVEFIDGFHLNLLLFGDRVFDLTNRIVHSR